MICDDCKKVKATHHYGLGAKRCDKCANVFNEKNRAERLARENEVHTCSCGEKYQGIYACPHCCGHEFDPSEGFHCLNCGTDGSEDVMSRAYDEAKDRRKYGE